MSSCLPSQHLCLAIRSHNRLASPRPSQQGTPLLLGHKLTSAGLSHSALLGHTEGHTETLAIPCHEVLPTPHYTLQLHQPYPHILCCLLNPKYVETCLFWVRL